MQEYIYLLAMLVSIGGFTLLDWRFKLAWFWDARRTAKYLLIAQAFFIIWDVINLQAGTFVLHTSEWTTGWYILSERMPLEEFLFFYFLNYQVLLVWRKLWPRTSS